MTSNWLKMYDKFGLILRVETVINRQLVAKIPRTRRWRVTERGRHLLALAVKLYQQTWPALVAA